MSAVKVDRAEFAVKFREGLNRKAMAEHFGVNATTITVVRKELGLPVFAGTPRLSEGDLLVIEALLDDGLSFSEINRSGGPTAVTLRKYFPGRGWEPQQRFALRRDLYKNNAGMQKHFGTELLTVRGT